MKWRHILLVLIVAGAASNWSKDNDQQTGDRLTPAVAPAKTTARMAAARITYPSLPEGVPWASVCGLPADPGVCAGAVGKHAYNAVGGATFSQVDLGPIIGTTWRPRGSLVSGLGNPVRTAPENGWYYIIGPGGVATYSFLRRTREIRPR